MLLFVWGGGGGDEQREMVPGCRSARAECIPATALCCILGVRSSELLYNSSAGVMELVIVAGTVMDG